MFTSALFWHLQKTGIYKNFRPSRVHFAREKLPAIFHSHGVTYLQRKKNLNHRASWENYKPSLDASQRTSFRINNVLMSINVWRIGTETMQRIAIIYVEKILTWQMLLLRCLHYLLKTSLHKERNKPSSQLFLAGLRWYYLIAMT